MRFLFLVLMSRSARDMLLQYMAGSTPGPNATNHIGIITLPDGRHLAIAVFVKDSPADEATREATIAKIARAAFDRWSPR
jgi:hypothetical protein